jgi:histone acetyltransferase (RNA polymerase elongator complex component)
MAVKKIIYPIFLPHAGCPFECVYCNQNSVVEAGLDERELLNTALSRLETYCREAQTSNRPGEIAFFGGTFTALPRDVLEPILHTATSHVRSGVFSGIRFSTRPDCMGEEVVEFLADYAVRTVELGVQSLCDEVLKASGRGYSTLDVYEAAQRVKRRSWDLGIQLMAGLPADSGERFLKSVRGAVAIRPDFVRIYPTLVLEGTRLAGSFRRGEYVPLSLDEANAWVLPAYTILHGEGIPVIRMGLHADPALEKPGVVLAGPYHPAFGYLVRCRWWRARLDAQFASLTGLKDSELVLRVPERKISDIVGPKRCNIQHWMSTWELGGLKVCEDRDLSGTEIRIDGARLMLK